MRIKTVANKIDDFEAIWQCWTSQQMSHAQLELHLKDADFAEWYKAKIAVVEPSPAAPNADALAAEMLAGLEGVTPGEWAIRARDRNEHEWEVYPLRDGPPKIGQWVEIALCPDQWDEENPDEAKNNATHIAACSPANIRALLSERAAMKAEIERLRLVLGKADEELAAAGYRPSQWPRPQICAALKGADHD